MLSRRISVIKRVLRVYFKKSGRMLVLIASSPFRKGIIIILLLEVILIKGMVILVLLKDIKAKSRL
jgi:hypothetical protein